MHKELTESQVQKLQEVLKFASKESPFYKSKFAKLAPQLLRVTSYSDFQKIPTTPTDEFKENNRDFLTDLKYVWRVWCTTGTTGKPKISFCGFDLRKAYKEEYEFALRQAGITNYRGLTAGVFYPFTGLAGAAVATAKGLEELGIPVVAFGIDSQPTFADMIMRDVPVNLLFIFPSSFLLFTDGLKKINPDFAKFNKVKAIFSCGEPLTNNMRSYFETTWHAKCFDMVGGVDIANFTGAECNKHNGFHLFTDMFLFELYNHEKEDFKLEGEGELVLTSFGNQAMPLIRYFTRDQVKISYEKCICGLDTPRMWFKERLDDRVILTGAVKFYVSEHINEVLSHHPEVTSAYQVKISNENGKDYIDLTVEADDRYVGDKGLQNSISDDIILRSPDLMEVVHQDKTLAMPSVKIVSIGTLERVRGKVKDRLIDTRKK